MKERTIEIKILKKQFCYKEIKGRTEEEKKCSFGFENYQDKCINCRWYGENILSTETIGIMSPSQNIKEEK